MAKPDILLVEPLKPEPVMAELEREFAVHRLPPGGAAALAPELRARIVGVATTGAAGADAALIDALPQLGIVACYGVGVDAVDLAAARRRGVVVTNTPDVLTEDVADLAVALWLAAARRVGAGDRFVRAGRWGRDAFGLSPSVRGTTVGFLGFGRIGQAIARRMAPFGVGIRYCKRRPIEGSPHPFDRDLRDLARLSDCLIVCCPGGAETRHLVGGEVLAALGPRGLLVNIARGSVVDEAALVAALEGGRLGAAALDVFEREPAVPEALLGRDDVVLTPHIGSATVETRLAMGRLVIANLKAFTAGMPVPTPV